MANCFRCEGRSGWADQVTGIWQKCTYSKCVDGQIVEANPVESQLSRKLRLTKARIIELEDEIRRLKGGRFQDPIPVEPHPLIPWPPNFSEPGKWRFPLPCDLPSTDDHP